jgi:ceramide glucosyltransferase
MPPPVGWEPLLWGLTILGLIAFAVACWAVAVGFWFRRRVLAARVWDRTAFAPRILVLVPCRGADPNLEANLAALLAQEYPAYRVVFCVDRLEDPAVAVIERIRARHPVRTDIALASDLPGLGGKALALLAGLATASPTDEAFVFLDSDIRPGPDFVRALVQPLALPTVGATTGYRWYVPVRGGLWSVVRSAWNAAGFGILFSDRYSFLWGGAWAIRRETLDRLDLEGLWRGTLSEDLAVTEAIKGAGLKVQFVPQSVAATLEDCDRAECVAWTDRQTAMVALWGRHIRNFAALTYGAFDGSVLLGLLCGVLAVWASPLFLIPAFLFLFDLPVAVVNGRIRRRAVFLGSPGLAPGWRVSEARWAVANLIVPWLTAGNLLRTRRVRTIEWRGKRYQVAAGTIRVA